MGLLRIWGNVDEGVSDHSLFISNNKNNQGLENIL